MGARSVEVSGPLDAAAVWERYAVPGSWPDWLPQITSVDLSTPRLSPGAKGTGGAEPMSSGSSRPSGRPVAVVLLTACRSAWYQSKGACPALAY